MNDLIPVLVAAERAGCSQVTIRNWINAGKLARHKHNGKLHVSARELARVGQTATVRTHQKGELSQEEFMIHAGINTQREMHALRKKGIIGPDNTRENAERVRNMYKAEPVTKDARARKEMAQAEIAELKLAEARGKVYAAEDVERAMVRAANTTRAQFQALVQVLPAELSRLIEMDETKRLEVQAQIRAKLSPRIKHALDIVRDAMGGYVEYPKETT